MEKVNDLIVRYLFHFMAGLALAIFGLIIVSATTNASQDERLKAQEKRDEVREIQMGLIRSENREDHKVIQAKLDQLTERGAKNP